MPYRRTILVHLIQLQYIAEIVETAALRCPDLLTSTNMRKYIITSMQVCVCVCGVHACACVRACVRVWVCVNIYRCVYMCIYIYIYVSI